jgi:Tfp pilus assembly protein PilE
MEVVVMDTQYAFPDISYPHSKGMTLRDYFAAAALTGILADYTVNSTDEILTKTCYRMADAMLRERNKLAEPTQPGEERK